jgi:regulator of CtrA degradation
MNSKDFTKAGTSGNLLFLPRIYGETMQLLVEAHDYFHQHGAQDQERLDARQRPLYCSEMSRITMRLSCVMAWLLARRAITSEEMPLDTPIGSYRLDCRDICERQNPEAEAILPPFMHHLMERSLELYERVARLDDEAGKRQDKAQAG